MTTRRGTTNGSQRGNNEDRRRRREWLIQTYRAEVDLLRVEWHDGRVVTERFVLTAERLLELYGDQLTSATPIPSCRCYRCGTLLTADTVTVDRIIPGCKGGTYRRDNIRPACGPCNSATGGALATRKAS